MAAIEETFLARVRRERNDVYYVPGGLLQPHVDRIESSTGLTRPDFNEKAERSVRARRCKTGYISLIFTAWGEPMISSALPEDRYFIDIKILP